MNKQSQYNQFHKKTSYQSKPINSNNFTYKKILKNINTVLNSNQRFEKILDFGCGSGTLGLYLGSIGYDVVGVDISDKAIRYAKQSSKIMNLKKVKFILSSDLKKIKRKFDLIICTEVIEHLDDDAKELRMLASLLSNKGVLYISTPSLNAPLYRLGLLKDFDKEVGHVRRYSKNSLVSLIHSIGLTPISFSREEGILRNSLYTLKPLGWMVRFVKGPLVPFVSFLDSLTIPILGESNFHILAQKS